MCALVTNLCVSEHTSESLRVFTFVIPELENKHLLYSSRLIYLKQFLGSFCHYFFAFILFMGKIHVTTFTVLILKCIVSWY